MHCQRGLTSCRVTDDTDTESSSTTNTLEFWVNATFENLIYTLQQKKEREY